MLACETEGQVLRCLLSGVTTPHLGNRSCVIPQDDPGGRAGDPERAGMGLGSLHGLHGEAGCGTRLGYFRSPANSLEMLCSGVQPPKAGPAA